MIAALFAIALIPQSAPIGTAAERVRDPVREHAPALVRRGYALFQKTKTPYNRSALSCGMCHLNAGQKEGALPLVGIAAVFPEYNKRCGRPFTLEDRIVGCFLRSLNAPPGLAGEQHENAAPNPPATAPEVQAIAAYLRWLSEGVTAEDLKPFRKHTLQQLPLEQLDAARGKALYVAKCVQCHGRHGQGVAIGGLKPGPLWGPRSWNDGAGAARIYTLAGYLRHAMPYLAPGSLSDEEAQQIAAYLTAQKRPAFAAKDRDFRVEKLPPDAVYYTRR